MKEYMKKSIPTVLFLIVITLLQFVPSSISYIATIVTFVGYFGYVIYLMKKKMKESVIMNMCVFSIVLLIYILIVEVVL